MTTSGAGTRVSLWRDYSEEVVGLPGAHLGHAVVHGDVARRADEFYAGGARRVDLPDTVEISDGGDAAAVRALTLIRELTAHGMVVGWRLRVDAAFTDWYALSALYPPVQVDGGFSGGAGAEACAVQPASRERGDSRERGVLGEWRRDFFVGKLGYRTGPGFVEVRDRRRPMLVRIVIDESGHLRAVRELLPGARADDVAAGVLADLEAERLVGRVGRLVWWLPYRVRRWPHPPMSV